MYTYTTETSDGKFKGISVDFNFNDEFEKELYDKLVEECIEILDTEITPDNYEDYQEYEKVFDCLGLLLKAKKDVEEM